MKLDRLGSSTLSKRRSANPNIGLSSFFCQADCLNYAERIVDATADIIILTDETGE